MPDALLKEIKYQLMSRQHFTSWYTLSHICIKILLQQDKKYYLSYATILALACNQQVKISVL